MLRARHLITYILMAVHATSLLPAAPSVAVVTGGNRGLGYAIAKRLLRDSDFTVVLASRSLASGQAAASTLLAEESSYSHARPVKVVRETEAPAPRVVAIQLDVTCNSSLDAFCAQLLADHGQPALVVNNAAVCIRNSGSNGEANLDDLQRSIAVNFHGPVRLVQRLYGSDSSTSGPICTKTSSELKATTRTKERRGSVINVSSGDGELVWLNSRLAEALRQCCTPEDVMALASLELGLSGTVDGSLSALEASIKSRLLLNLVQCGDELAFGPTPAYAVSKALLNAWTRTVGTVKSEGGVVKSDSWDTTGCRNSDTAVGPLEQARLCIDTINCVCPGDVIGSNMYSGAATSEANAQWHYKAAATEAKDSASSSDSGSGHCNCGSGDSAAAGTMEGTEGGERWDVTLEEAARDVCALIGTKKSGAFFRFGSEVEW